MQFKMIVLFGYLSALALLNVVSAVDLHLMLFFIPYNVQPGDIWPIISLFMALIFFFMSLLFFSQRQKNKTGFKVTAIKLLGSIMYYGLASILMIVLRMVEDSLLYPGWNKLIFTSVTTLLAIIMIYYFILAVTNYLAIKVLQRQINQVMN